MADTPTAAERIDAAIARIEAAVDTRAADAATLSRRHAVLRERMAEAVSALDAVIAKASAN